MLIEINTLKSGTETILSNENLSLKEKIKELEKEIEILKENNIKLGSRIQKIRRISCYDEDDVQIND